MGDIDRRESARGTEREPTDRSRDAATDAGHGRTLRDREGALGQTRRSLLRATAGLVATGLGGSAVAGTATAGGGDDGDYQAPDDYPLVSTRGHFDDDGNYTDGATRTNYYGEGDWERYTEPDHDEVHVVVHGNNQDETEDDDVDFAYTCEVALERNGVDQTTVGFSWDAEPGWYTAVDVARKNGPKLAKWTADHLDMGGKPVRYVAHSLGARVVCAALKQLHSWGYRNAVRSVSLLGAAVPDQSVSTERTYGSDVAYATEQLRNYYKTDDAVLSWAYSAAVWDTALGEQGIQDGLAAPANYRERDVTDTVPDHGSYYEPGDGCMPTVVSDF